MVFGSFFFLGGVGVVEVFVGGYVLFFLWFRFVLLGF